MWQGIPYLAAFLISSAIGIAAVIALETLQRNPRNFCGTAFDGNASFSIIVKNGHDGDPKTGGPNLSYCARDMFFMLPPLFCCLLISLLGCCCRRKQCPVITPPPGTFRVHLTGVLSGVDLNITRSALGQPAWTLLQIDDLRTKLQELTGADITNDMVEIKPTNHGAAWLEIAHPAIANAPHPILARVRGGTLVDAEVKLNLITKMRWFGDVRYTRLRALRLAMLGLVVSQCAIFVWVLLGFHNDVKLGNSTNSTHFSTYAEPSLQNPEGYSKYGIIPLEVAFCQMLKTAVFCILIVIEFHRFRTTLTSAFASMNWLAAFYVFFFIGAFAQMVTNFIGVNGKNELLQIVAQILATFQFFAASVLMMCEMLPRSDQLAHEHHARIAAAGDDVHEEQPADCCGDFKSFFLPFYRSGGLEFCSFLVIVALFAIQGYLTVNTSARTGLVIVSASSAYGPDANPGGEDDFQKDVNQLLLWFALLQLSRNFLAPLCAGLLQQFVSDNRRTDLLSAIFEQRDPRETVGKSDKSQKDTATSYNKDVADSVVKKVAALTKIAESSGKMVGGLIKIGQISTKMLGFCIIVYFVAIMVAYVRSTCFEKPRGDTIQRAKKEMETEAAALIGKNYYFAVTNQIADMEAAHVHAKAGKYLKAQTRKSLVGGLFDLIGKAVLIWVGRVGSIYFAARLLERGDIDPKEFGKLVGMQLTMMMAAMVFATQLENLFSTLGEFDTRINAIFDNRETPAENNQAPIVSNSHDDLRVRIEYQRNFQMQAGTAIHRPGAHSVDVNINMHQQPRSRRLGIHGASGAGKSSIVQIFQGWLQTHVNRYPDANGAHSEDAFVGPGGFVCNPPQPCAQRARIVVPLFNGNGRIRGYDLEAGAGNVGKARRVTSYAPTADGVVVFEGRTWRENLIGCHPPTQPPLHASQETTRIREAIAIACAGDFIPVNNLDDQGPEPYGNLSTGQRKRLGLVRALCKPTAEIYLFDEPEANLSATPPNPNPNGVMSMKDQVINNLITFSDQHLDKVFVIITHDIDVLNTFCHERFGVPGPLP